MKQYRVAILGASGAVGQEMMKILAERKFPVGELHLLASARSAGKVVSWQGQNIALEEATDAAFAGMDIVLGAAEKKILFRRIIVRLFVRTPRLRSKAAIWFRPRQHWFA